MSLRVEVDKSLCMSSGMCVADHPSAFRFDDDQLAETTAGATTAGDDDLRDAAMTCPAMAILLRDADGNQVDPFA
ncbi:ferredoxin [Euzebya tangerina]|uniref:ferredoxin n=1 Tax=Euzebya tangerina TaxID=591198 RepID=UPI000E31EFCB|nr:ferredoxin [Euzebya tangerina]